MRSVRLSLPFALLLVVCATGAFAQSLSVAPDSFYLYSSEVTMDLRAGGDFGLDHNDLVFTGPDSITMPIDAVYGSFMEVSVPTIVTFTAGTWNVQVFAYDAPDATPRVFGPASFSVVPRPQTDPPLLSIPENVVVAATSASGAIATFSVSAQNLDGSPVPVTCDHNSGDLFPLGATNVHCSATNGFGTTSGSFPVFVSDLTAPVLSLPADIVTSNHVVSFTVTATDDLDPSPTVECSPASGSTFPDGETIVQCSALDNFANVAYGTFKVTVVTGPPTLTLPADITAEATSSAGAVVTYTATADQNATVVCNPPSGSTFPLGTTTVNCTATNILNQTTTGSFNITVVDTTPPSITSLTANPATLWPDDHKMVNVTITGTATDLVDANPTLTIISVTSDQPVVTNSNQDQSPDWVVTGLMTLKLRQERTNGQDRTYTITVQAIDFSGNTSTATVQVVVTQQPGPRRAASH